MGDCMNKGIKLIEPYGGTLKNLVVLGEQRLALLDEANRYPSIQITDRNLNDLELLATGGFSPLNRFMGEADYRRVLTEMRLQDGTLFPIPVTLPLQNAGSVRIGSEIALRSSNNDVIALMVVEEIFTRDHEYE